MMSMVSYCGVLCRYTRVWWERYRKPEYGRVLCAGVRCHMVDYCAAGMLGCGGLGVVRWCTVHCAGIVQCAGMPWYGLTLGRHSASLVAPALPTHPL